MSSQAWKLIDTITFVIDQIENDEKIMPEIKKIGLSHKEYNVKPEHYSIALDAFNWAWENVLGDEYTSEMKQVWSKFYNGIASLMIEELDS